MQNNERNKIASPAGGPDLGRSVRATDYRSLILFLADRIGRQHIPVREHANDIHDLLGADAVHHELVKNIVRRVYRANHCGHLSALVTQDATFEVLGEIRKELASCQFTDIDQINLLESVGDACIFWFRSCKHGVEPRADGPAEDRNPQTAKVVPLSNTG